MEPAPEDVLGDLLDAGGELALQGKGPRHQDGFRLAHAPDEDDEVTVEANAKLESAPALVKERLDRDHGARMGRVTPRSRGAQVLAP